MPDDHAAAAAALRRRRGYVRSSFTKNAKKITSLFKETVVDIQRIQITLESLEESFNTEKSLTQELLQHYEEGSDEYLLEIQELEAKEDELINIKESSMT